MAGETYETVGSTLKKRVFDAAGIDYGFIESTQQQIEFEEEVIASLTRQIVAREDAFPDATPDTDRVLRDLYAQLEEYEQHVGWMKECIERAQSGEPPYAESFEQYKERVGPLYAENTTDELSGDEIRIADAGDAVSPTLPIDAMYG